MSDLFIDGQFELHSGQSSTWKVECDALSEAELKVLSDLLAGIVLPFSEVVGVPRGGLALAELMVRHATKDIRTPRLLIVDDVFSTGGSLQAARARAVNDEGWQVGRVIGGVLFSRSTWPLPPWVRAVWALNS